MARKSFRTDAEKKLVKEISNLSTRLQRRLTNINKKGLNNFYSDKASAINTSVKNLKYRDLLSLKRTLKKTLEQQSTRVRGAKHTQNVWDSIEDTINLKSKKSRRRVHSLLNKAYELFPIYRDKNYRYGLRDIINRMIQNRKQNKTILKKIEELASTISAEGYSGFDKEVTKIKFDYTKD